MTDPITIYMVTDRYETKPPELVSALAVETPKQYRLTDYAFGFSGTHIDKARGNVFKTPEGAWMAYLDEVQARVQKRHASLAKAQSQMVAAEDALRALNAGTADDHDERTRGIRRS